MLVPGPPKEPKLTLPLCPWLGGLPPLADGWGIGEGELAGEVMRGFAELFTPSELPDWSGWCGVTFIGRGEPSALYTWPNFI